MTFERFFERQLDFYVQRTQEIAGHRFEKPERKWWRAIYRTHPEVISLSHRFYELCQ